MWCAWDLMENENTKVAGKRKFMLGIFIQVAFCGIFARDKRLKCARKQNGIDSTVVRTNGQRTTLRVTCTHSIPAAAAAVAVDVHCALLLPAALICPAFPLQNFFSHSFFPFSVFNSHLFILRVLKLIQLYVIFPSSVLIVAKKFKLGIHRVCIQAKGTAHHAHTVNRIHRTGAFFWVKIYYIHLVIANANLAQSRRRHTPR